jgi:hypothetical protein
MYFQIAPQAESIMFNFLLFALDYLKLTSVLLNFSKFEKPDAICIGHSEFQKI